MERYDELIKSLENYRDIPNDCGRTVFKQTAEAIEALQTAVEKKQKLLDEALGDLSNGCDCKYCSNISQCNTRRIERNFAYGSCDKWQWRGKITSDKAS